MYRLYMIEPNKWQIHSSRKGAFEGSLRQVITFAVIELGMEFNELNVGVQEMEKYGHNGIEFGILKKFLFTFDNESKRMAH